jgi:hypothetical protein
VDQLRTQLQQSEALLKASRSSNSQLEADVLKQKSGMDHLRAEAERLSGLAKDEEEKRSKAVSLLKTVRQKLVKAEKEREDVLKEVASSKDSQRIEREKAHLDREKLQGELNRLKIEKEVSLADLRAQLEKDLSASKQLNERELFALRNQFELETTALKVRFLSLAILLLKLVLTSDSVKSRTGYRPKRLPNRSPREICSGIIRRKGQFVRSTSDATSRSRILPNIT